METPETKENQSPDDAEISFEAAIKELEGIIQRMSSGEQTLESSITEFERGVKIARECQKMLKDAQQRVELLTNSSDNQNETQPFNPE